MSQVIKTTKLPATMNEKLRSIRRRQTVLVVARALAIGASVLIGAMLVAMALDWWLTLFSTPVRTVLTVTSLGLAVVACLAAGVRPLLATLGWKRAAVSADDHVPELEERWTTVASFAVSESQPTTSEGRAMLEQVTSEAIALGRLVKPQQVARPRAVRPALLALAGCVLALAGFLAIDWPQTSVLLRRFWSPTAPITATQLRNVTGDVTIPRGESVELMTEQSGRLHNAALLTLEYDSGTVDVFELETDAGQEHAFQYSLRADDSFRYRVRAGDGRTEWRSVTVIDYPALAEVQFTVTSPDYIDRPPFEKTLIPGRVRVAQGSQLELAMKPVEELDRLELTLTFPDGEDEEVSRTLTLTPDVEGWYRFESQLLEDISLSPALFNSYGLTNELRSVCRIHVIPDQAPVARVITPTDEMVVAADEVIDIEFEAHDDYGVATAELVVYDESLNEAGVEPRILSVQPIPLGDQTLEQHVLASAQLNLKDLHLEEGMNVSYAVRVTDNRRVNISPEMMAAQRAEARPGQNDEDQSMADGSNPSDEQGQPADTTDGPKFDDSLDNALADARNWIEQRTQRDAAEASNAIPGDRQEADSDAPPSADGESGAEEPSDHTAQQSDPSSGEGPQVNSERRPASETPVATPTNNDNPERRTPGEATPSSEDREAGDDSAVKANETPESEAGEPGESTPTENPSENALAQNSADPESATDPDRNDGESRSGRRSVAVANRDDSESADDPSEPMTGDSASAQSGADPESDNDSDRDPSGEGTPSNDDRGESDTAVAANESPAGEAGEPGESASTENASESEQSSAERETAVAETDSGNAQTDSDSDSDSEEERSLAQSDGDQNSDPENNPTDRESPQESQTAQAPSDRSQSGQGGGQSGQPLPPLPFELDRQQAQAGQNAETRRRTLKIVERIAALAAADENDGPGESMAIRDRVVAIDRMLADVESGLTRVVQREIPDADRSGWFGILDEQLGGVETYIADLREETSDDQFEFVGLQMVDIGRTHVTPARDRVFAAIRDAGGADRQATDALQHVVRARELLADLLERYDAVVRERKLADELDEAFTMYEVYVEKMRQLMREARQNLNPLDRKMGIIEVEQDYLDRRAEVERLRREMMREFARMLADDPRLLARYMDLIKRRRTSLRDELTKLAERQYDASTELSGWLAANDDQRRDLWMLIAEMRLQAATTLARDAAELAERLDKQMPLVLDPENGTAAQVIEHAAKIARLARDTAFDADGVVHNAGVVGADSTLLPNSERLVWTFGELDATLDRLNFENEGEEEVADYVTARLLESRTVADQADAWLRLARFITDRKYHGMAEVDQENIAIATELLRVEMLGIEDDLNGQFQQLFETDAPGEIVDMIRELHRVMEGITFNQAAATFAMSGDRLQTAERRQAAALDGFDRAEELFDQIRRAAVDALDEYDLPDPNIADLEDPTLDEFLANLEREPNIEAQLGIPNRPRNLRIIADSLLFDQEGEDDIGASGDAAIARAQEAMRRQRNRTSDEEERPRRPLTDEEREQQMAAEQMKEMIERSLASIQEKIDDPATSAQERQRLEQMAEQLRQMQGVNGQQPRQAWEQLAGSDEAREILRALAMGQPIPDQQWNHLLSTLDEGLWQVQGRTPPEDYRQAIEEYQGRIRQLVDAYGTEEE
jgi:hypothetical protein